MKSCSYKIIVGLAPMALAILNSQVATASAQGTAFTYQGRLNDSGGPANGTYNLTFTLFTNSSGGTAVAGPVTNSAVSVTNGLFTVLIDFGPDAFTGATNWLQIGVATNGVSTFTTLTPRQELTPTPYAIYAENASAAGITGTIQAASLGGIYGNSLTFSNPANSFSGNGSGLTGVNAAALNGLNSSNFWQTTGNAGTSPADGNFVGTTDNQPLELWVNGSRALRLEPGETNGAPNLIGGSPVNFVPGGIVGAVIAGGGTTNFFGIAYTNRALADFGAIGGGLNNSVVGDYATVPGGIGNSAGGGSAVVGGGAYNYAGNDYSAVGGGFANIASGIGAFIGGGGYDGNNYQGNQTAGNASFIGGGLNNAVNAGANYAVIGGGDNNAANGSAAVVSGGEYNTASYDHTTVAGGQGNTAGGSYASVGGGSGNNAEGAGDVLAGGYNNVSAGGNNSTISGGNNNNSSGSDAVIGGGQQNLVSAFYATIGGGVNNTATNNSSLVSGGTNNVSGGYASTVAGGSDNAALGDYSFAAGNFAQATNNNSFVWSDGSTNTASTTTNQFVARASGGFVLFSSKAGTGVSLAPGSGSWSTMSDRNAKDGFAPVNSQAVLAAVASLPMTTWSYRTEPGVRHVGPMAQDFHAAFAVGEDDRHIAEVDEGGVALAAIQGLNGKLEVRSQKSERQIEELKSENTKLQAQVTDLRSQLEALQKTVARFAARSAGSLAQNTQPPEAK